MFAIASTSALTVRAKAPVRARTAAPAKASLLVDAKKAAKKASVTLATIATTMLPAAAALAEEEAVAGDLKLYAGLTVALGIAAFSTLPEPESSKHGADH